jgi:16S rRNA (uracil1498-N3)-methyltransferase
MAAMPHTHRFYIPSDTPPSERVLLPPDEAHHAARVVRVRSGDAVVLFDGAGREWAAVIEEVSKRDVRVRVIGTRDVPPASRRVTLFQAWPNHEKTAETIVRRGTELGVAAFCFFRGAHSERAPKMSEKWQKTAVETCKQCHRAWLPEFRVARDVNEATDGFTGTLLVATTARAPEPLEVVVRGEDVGLVVGPEGDLGEAELALLMTRRAHPISLGDFVLRSEVAATVAITLVQYELGNLGPRSRR